MSVLGWVASATLLLGSCDGGVSDPDRMEIFDSISRTIGERFYDPAFGGKDWEAIVSRYRPRVEDADPGEATYVLLNEMLFELGVSHTGVIPAEHPEWIGAPSVFSDAGVGLDARVVDGEGVVVRVRPRSPAAEAGIRPGFVLLRIDEISMDEIRDEALTPPLAPLDRRLLVNQALQQKLYGPSGSEVSITFQDAADEERSVTLRRVERPGRSVFAEGLPPMFLELESRRIGDDVGYLRFNAFSPDLLDEILAAVDELADTAGIVIDLRGNPGGAFPVRRALAERLVAEPCVIWRQRGRNETHEVHLTPPREPYEGVVAILTDAMSASSSEEFSGGLQALGRAVVIGERTPGDVLIADLEQLGEGVTLVFPIAEAVLADGRTLEGVGVVPDVGVPYDRASLLEGRDAQLEAALAVIQERLRH